MAIIDKNKSMMEISIRNKIKCNCGCLSQDHHGGFGWCSKCGCTFYWPNDKWIKKFRALNPDYTKVSKKVKKIRNEGIKNVLKKISKQQREKEKI
jgi:hypothetical protein